jgi:hypothetical protein
MLSRVRSPAPPLISVLSTRDELVRWLGFSSYEDAIGRLRSVAPSRAIERYAEIALTAARTVGRGEIVEYLEARIDRDVSAIGDARGDAFTLEYFQYLALLSFEAYLYRMFHEPDVFRESIRLASKKILTEVKVHDDAGDLSLSRVAFWAATGAGKTLLTHVNLLQYRRYAAEASQVIDATLLITPNEGLSRQHLKELRRSGIAARLFQRDAQPTLSMGPVVEVMDIHKIRRQGGDTTVDVATFAGNNLILIDEAHRGATGAEWLKIREEVVGGGFTMEYSATFGQAVAAARKPALLIDYSRSIVFEYSYGRFHEDGYGKDYDILNVAEKPSPERYRRYFLGALLVYLSQHVAYTEASRIVKTFGIARPLMLLAGTRVNALVSEAGTKTSDLLEYVRFLSWVVQGDGVVDLIDEVLRGASQVTDRGQDVFFARLSYLRAQAGNAGQVYRRLLRLICNSAAPGDLVLRRNGDTGELLLSVAEAPAFGLITIGDDSTFFKLCRDEGAIIAEEDSIGTRLFDELDSEASTLTVVLGAKKFIEGWDTQRVSAMAFANIGRSEGSEVIQLFGRGVRLRGYEGCMRRSSSLDGVDAPPELRYLETLEIFGLRADYLATFRSILEEEQVTSSVSIPSRLNIAGLSDAPYPRQDAAAAVMAQNELLPIPPGFRRNRIALSYFAVASVLTSTVANEDVSEVRPFVFNRERISKINLRRTAYRLLNVLESTIPLSAPLRTVDLEQLLLDNSWYSVAVPKATSLEAEELDELAFQLLRSYCKELARRRVIEQVRGQISFLKVETALGESPAYVVKGERTDSKELDRVRDTLARAVLPNTVEGMRVLNDEFLVRRPLLGGGRFDVRPPSLNPGEVQFLDDLTAYLKSERQGRLVGWTVHVLRNDVGRTGTGLSTGEGRFFPDFLLWFERSGRYRLALVDPKGLGRMGTLTDAKVEFVTSLREVPRPSNLDAFDGAIVSITRRSELAWASGISADAFLEAGVLFQVDDGPRVYIDQLLDRLGIPRT